eukprot:gene14981-17716_t
MSQQQQQSSKVWFVTGASKGLGLATVKHLLEAGQKVVGTSRNKSELNKVAGNDSENFLALQVDLENEASIKAALEKTIKQFGSLDVLVNNAGYGLIGALEELSDLEVRKNFEVNVFAVFTILRTASHIFRQQKSGIIINVSSVAGFLGNFPGWSAYAGTKFALDGLTESYAEEMRPFGVKVCTVNPGYFRTNFLTSLENEKPKESLYQAVTDSIGFHTMVSGKQPGDPAKFANFILELVNHKGDLPSHIFVGADANKYALAKIEKLTQEIKDWQHLTTKTDHDDVQQQVKQHSEFYKFIRIHLVPVITWANCRAPQKGGPILNICLHFKFRNSLAHAPLFSVLQESVDYHISLLVLVASAVDVRTKGQKTTASSTPCRGITFSGAGDRGAYEVGVLVGLTQIRQPEEYAWKFVAGISAGNLNGAYLSMYNVGDEVRGATDLQNTWLATKKENIWVEWPLGPLEGLLEKNGIFNDAPIIDFIAANMNQTAIQLSDRVLNVQSTCLDTGLQVTFNNSDPHLHEAVKASASIPGIFPPTMINGYSFVDGGTTYMTPITDTARLCYDTGATDVIIDAVLGVGHANQFDNVTKLTTIPLLMRSASIVTNNWNVKDIETVFQAFPNVTLQVYIPSVKLPGEFLFFQYTAEMIKIGISDATKESNTFRLNRHNYKEFTNMLSTMYK